VIDATKIHELPLTAVKVTRRREREELGDIEELAISIAKFGLLQPIVVDDDNELIAGFRRFTAHQQNGAVTILAIRQKDIDEATAKELELEENFRRKDMTTYERVKGLAELHRLRTEKDPNWNQVKTAQLAGGGTSQRDVSQAVSLNKMMDLFPELRKAKSINQAQNWAKAKAASVQRVIEVKENPKDYADIESKLILGDSVEVIKTIADETFHAIITDPPFGIGYEDRTAGNTDSVTAYEDDEAKYRRILSMAPDMYRVLKPNGWCVWFLGMTWYQEAKETFRAAGFTVDEIPIIWDRSAGRCFTTRPDRWFPKGYDIALHMLKGEPKMAKPLKSNILAVAPVPTEDREQSVERPVELYKALINALTIPGEKVADFFAGSGSCPAACEETKRDWFAVEKSPERRARAIQKIKAYTPDK
jgi:site-specific DNA-methyltransferase (adenine-specific)